MILTTHFMDEADLLGDRIAIMAEVSHAFVLCCWDLRSCVGMAWLASGSSSLLWLANVPETQLRRRLPTHHGQSFREFVPLESECCRLLIGWFRQSGTKVDDVTSIVKSIDGAELLSNVGTELSFRLPMHESNKLPTMLGTVRLLLASPPIRMHPLFTDCIYQFCWHQLDQRLPELGIVSYGIGVTTMEEVFLRVAEEGAIAAAERDNRTSCCPLLIRMCVQWLTRGWCRVLRCCECRGGCRWFPGKTVLRPGR
jgi:ATP-binding cassette, subfamily A (ABC1), member 3